MTDAQTARAIVEREAHLLTVDVPAMFDRIAEGIAQALAATRAAAWERAAQVAEKAYDEYDELSRDDGDGYYGGKAEAAAHIIHGIRALTHPTPEPKNES